MRTNAQSLALRDGNIFSRNAVKKVVLFHQDGLIAPHLIVTFGPCGRLFASVRPSARLDGQLLRLQLGQRYRSNGRSRPRGKSG